MSVSHPLIVGIILYSVIAAGGTMPDPAEYIFPKQIGTYIFDWLYHFVKVMTNSLAKQVQKNYPELKDGLPHDTPPVSESPTVNRIPTATESKGAANDVSTASR